MCDKHYHTKIKFFHWKTKTISNKQILCYCFLLSTKKCQPENYYVMFWHAQIFTYFRLFKIFVCPISVSTYYEITE